MAKEPVEKVDIEAHATRILTAQSTPENAQSRANGTQHPFGEDKPIYLSPGVGHGLGSPVSFIPHCICLNAFVLFLLD
jgi:hypothetical protein